jgi:glycosyltransferase involved in cell wall biosynthesis
MKLAFVSRHSPRPEGTPNGRIFHALGEGLVAEGHEVEAVSWASDQPHDDLPDWCTWRPVPPEPTWRMKARALLRPRWDVARIDWEPPAGFVPIAEDPLSYHAVAGRPGATVVFNYLTKIDAPAIRKPTPRDWQDIRHEAHVIDHAPRVLAFSERVKRRLGGRPTVVPMAYPVPDEPLPFVEEPVALLLANWEWAPNRAALEVMLRAWPEVRAEAPAATLVLAGWGLDRLGVSSGDGVDVMGSVSRAVDALQRAAVLAFPCPPTSGPKVKVLEAVSYGLPVLTTPSGAEGLVLGPDEGAVVTGVADFPASLAALLNDPDRRRRVAKAGREAALAHHAPRPAARARVAAREGTLT